MPPPAVLPMFEHPAPISSMTWMMNFICAAPTTEDRWWLMRATAEHAVDGYSSQDLAIWNTDGRINGHRPPEYGNFLLNLKKINR